MRRCADPVAGAWVLEPTARACLEERVGCTARRVRTLCVRAALIRRRRSSGFCGVFAVTWLHTARARHSAVPGPRDPDRTALATPPHTMRPARVQHRLGHQRVRCVGVPPEVIGEYAGDDGGRGAFAPWHQWFDETTYARHVQDLAGSSRRPPRRRTALPARLRHRRRVRAGRRHGRPPDRLPARTGAARGAGADRRPAGLTGRGAHP